MGINWLVVKDATGDIESVGGGTAAPTKAGYSFPVADADLLDSYHAAKQAMHREGRYNEPELFPGLAFVYPHWNGSVVEVPADTRPVFKVETDKTLIVADGADVATITITKVLGKSGAVDTAFSSSTILRTRHSQFALTFVNGVAKFRFATTKPIQFCVYSNPERAVDGHVTLNPLLPNEAKGIKLLDATYPEAP